MAWFNGGDGQHFVYTLCNRGGIPIYVGYTNNPNRRIAEHRLEKPWFDEVATVDIERYRTRGEALKEEAMRIQFGEFLNNQALHSGIFREAFEDARNGIHYEVLEAYENVPVGRL